MADRRLCEGMAAGILNDVSDVPQPEFLIPPVRIDGPVRLAEPDPAWADWYARERGPHPQRAGRAGRAD